MSLWLSPSNQNAVRELVAATEAKTSAKLVVSVTASAGDYRYVDERIAALAALLALVVMLLVPLPIHGAVALGIGVAVYAAACGTCRMCPPLRRWFSNWRLRKHNVEKEAKACFLDQGIDHTADRTGVLVYVARFERAATVIADRGVPVENLGIEWSEAIADIDRAAGNGDPTNFLPAIDRLGGILAAHLPAKRQQTA